MGLLEAGMEFLGMQAKKKKKEEEDKKKKKDSKPRSAEDADMEFLKGMKRGK